jgi:tetratricopeptide (TPR) repeat protein
MTLGDALVAAHDDRGALLDYLDAINLDPLSAEPRLRLAGTYDRLSHLGQAVEQWQIAVELDPASEEARRLLQRGRAALAQGKSTTVEAPAPAPPPEPAAHAVPRAVAELYEAALKRFAERKYAESARSLDQVVQADPKLAIAFSARGSARFGQGLYRDAADDYSQALALDANLAMPLYGLAECHRMLQEAGAAEEFSRYAASAAPDVREELRADARKKASELGHR